MTATRLLVTFLLLAMPVLAASAGNDFVTLKSSHSAKATMDRIERLAKARGMTVFARIDHAAGAAHVGQTLRPTEVIVFGNPKAGTPLLQCAQTVGIDLPLKLLVWEDASAQVRVGYSDPVSLARRHGAARCVAAAQPLRKGLHQLAEDAVAP